MTPSERFVTKLCRESFLSPWTHANPERRPVKTRSELCDVLVAFESSVILFSVKESSSKRGQDPKTAWSRWDREAVKNSAKQLQGAERWLMKGEAVVESDGITPVILPDAAHIEIFRIAVALGFGGKAPVLAVRDTSGPTHVLDEVSLPIVLSELDTVADFIHYLRGCADLFHRNVRTVVSGGEHNMLACYLCNGRKFPDGADFLVVEDDFWDGFKSSEGYKRRLEENRVSYVWDALVDVLAATRSDWTVHGSCSEDPRKMVLEVIASENRFRRRLLGRALVEFLATHEETRARMVSVGSGLTYVYLNARADENPKDVMKELTLRCYLARGQVSENHTVVGIRFIGGRPPTEIAPESCLIRQEEWTAKDEAAAHELQQRSGFFSNPNLKRSHEDEFPQEAR